MYSIFTIVSAGLMAASQAPVTSPSEGVILWNTIRSGMTKQEVKAAQPNTTIRITDRCVAFLYFTYEARKLKSLKMESSTETPDDCRIVMIKSLAAKYGEQYIEETQHTRGDCGGYTGNKFVDQMAKLCRATGGENLVKHNFYTWVMNDIIVRSETTDQNSQWQVIYLENPKVTTGTLNNF